MKIIFASCLLTPMVLCSAVGCNSSPTSTVDLGTAADFSVGSDLSSSADLGTSPDLANAAPPTEVMVARVGDGTGALMTNTGTAVFLERRKIAGIDSAPGHAEAGRSGKEGEGCGRRR